MKSTISDVRQLFNVKALAAAGFKPGAIPNNSFGIVDEDANLTVLPTSKATLPDNFRFVGKVNGRTYFSIDTISKDCCALGRGLAKEYAAPKPETWSVTISHCDCIRSAALNIHISDDRLMRIHGMTWADRDLIVAVTREEVEAQCDCKGGVVHETYQNHVITKLLYQKLLALGSPFHTAIVQTTGGTVLSDVATVEAYIAANKAVNTDSDLTNDSDKLTLFVQAALPANFDYADLDANYHYPQGTTILPSVTVNGDIGVAFTKVASHGYRVGYGGDLRAEEFASMSLYTNLNHYPQLSCGLASPNLVYQFENSKQYHTVSFEASSVKSGLEDVPEGSRKKWHILLGTESMSVYNTLKALFA